MSDNLERFTRRARRALSLAQAEAEQLNHNYLGTEHLLLGLIDEEAGMAAKVLEELHVDFAELRQRILQTVGRGERKPYGPPKLAPRAQQVIEYAIAAARQLGHRYIGTEHLLLGMLQEGEGVGARVLTSFVAIGAIVDKVTEVVSKDPSGDPNLVARQREAVVKLEWLARQLAIKPLSVEELAGPRSLVAAMHEARNRQVYEAAVQEERSRLARDLHDSIKQQLFSISVSAAATQERLAHDLAGAKLALADVQASAQAAMVEMNALLHQLSPTPLAVAGLLAAMHEQCEALSYRTGAVVTTAFGDLPPPEQLPLGAQESIFRIVQEALANIARHARAQQVQVRLEQVDEGSTLRLEIRDDGQGFDPAMASAGMGLVNIQVRSERLNGRATISSAPGEGTSILVDIPLLPGEGGQDG